MISFAIIDDEPIAHRIIEGYCEDLKHLMKVGNCYNAAEAIEVLHREQVDLIFLDIKMPKMTGLAFLKSISDPPKVIITTAFKEHALEGYDLNVVDYLLKPFSFDRFIKAVNKIPAPKTAPPNPNKASSQISVKVDKKQHIIHLNDILFIEAFGNYCKVHLKEETLTTHQKISSFEKELPADFMRVHKSFIVAKHKVEEIDGNRLKVSGNEVPIGQTYRRMVKEWLDNFSKLK
ncbi:LytR/AlgR family response regulator transcription factor [Ekhidna sp.]|uniref:LytR/AlgR family response regulator transcription factor n=1 Tax=Ekhidna sp. TaxID=2608089 RepID=UPI003CCBE647